jgi:hypothetical protein
VVVGALQLKQRKLVDVLLAGGFCHICPNVKFICSDYFGKKLSTFYSSYLCKINIWWCRHFKKKKAVKLCLITQEEGFELSYQFIIGILDESFILFFKI